MIRPTLLGSAGFSPGLRRLPFLVKDFVCGVHGDHGDSRLLPHYRREVARRAVLRRRVQPRRPILQPQDSQRPAYVGQRIRAQNRRIVTVGREVRIDEEQLVLPKLLHHAEDKHLCRVCLVRISHGIHGPDRYGFVRVVFRPVQRAVHLQIV